MSYITSVEKLGFERGLKQGRQEAREQAREARRQALASERSLVLRLLAQKVGDLPPSLTAKIEKLSLRKIEALAIALLDFSSLTDLEAWLKPRPK
jgi:Domain of unknown function (DUF4351)